MNSVGSPSSSNGSVADDESWVETEDKTGSVECTDHEEEAQQSPTCTRKKQKPSADACTGLGKNPTAELSENTAPPHRCQPPMPFGTDHHSKDLLPFKPYLHFAQDSTDLLQWSDGRHRCTHSPSRPIDESEHFDYSCALLSFFERDYYSPVLRAIICPNSCSVYSLDMWLAETHRYKKHATSCTRSRPSTGTRGGMQEHILKAFPKICITRDDLLAQIQVANISEPLPGLPEPKETLTCPSCPKFFDLIREYDRDGNPRPVKSKTEARNLRVHWEKNRESCLLPALQQLKCNSISQGLRLVDRFMTVKCFTFSFLLSYRVQCSSAFASPGPLLTAAASSPSWELRDFIESPQYADELGWKNYLSGLDVKGKPSVRPSDILELVATPSSRTIDKWDGGHEGARVEEGLRILGGVIFQYLVDANNGVNQCADVVRQNLTTESVTFCLIKFITITHFILILYSSGARFRNVQDATCFRYRYAALRLCTMVVRFRLLWKFGLNGPLGSFEPKLTQSQNRLFNKLYRTLLAGQDTKEEDLAPILHAIILESSRLSLSPVVKVDSAVDQSIIFQQLTNFKNRYISPGSTTQTFAAWHRTIFSSFWHDSRLNGGLYELPNTGPDAEDAVLDQAGDAAGSKEERGGPQDVSDAKSNKDEGEGAEDLMEDDREGQDAAIETEVVEESYTPRQYPNVAAVPGRENFYDDDETGSEEDGSHDKANSGGVEILRDREGDHPLLVCVLSFCLHLLWLTVLQDVSLNIVSTPTRNQPCALPK